MSNRINFTEFPASMMEITAYLPTAIILPLGLIANISALVGLIYHLRRRAKNLIYFFIGSLILYDLALLTLYWPMELIKKTIAWPLGAFLCYFFNIFPIFCNSGPSFIMIGMIVDCYRVLVQQANPNPTACRKAIILTVIAVLALALAIPDLVFTAYRLAIIFFIGSDHLSFKPSMGCYISFYRFHSLLSWRIYYILLYMFIYILPLMIVFTLFFVIKSKLARLPSHDSTRVATESKVKFLHMTLYLMIVFVFFWSAEYIFYILYHFRVYGVTNVNSYRRFQFIYTLIQHFTLCKTIVNPFIYAYFIPEIKQTLMHAFTCGCLRQLRPSRFKGQSDMIKLTNAEE